MSKALFRDKDKSLQFEAITPEEVRKRARASQSSGLTNSLLSKSELKSVPSSRTAKAHPQAVQSRHSAHDLTNYGNALATMREASGMSAFLAEDDGCEVLSPGSMPIHRKPKMEKKMEEPQSELSKSVMDDDFIPPHILSFPAQSFDASGICSQPGSLYEGAGRKLRGMDAVRFRRNVMRQTGFLETTTENVVH